MLVQVRIHEKGPKFALDMEPAPLRQRHAKLTASVINRIARRVSDPSFGPPSPAIRSFCGVEVVAAMVPLRLEGGSSDALRYSNFICLRPRNEPIKQQRSRKPKGKCREEGSSKVANKKLLQELHAKDDHAGMDRRGPD